MPFPFSYSFVAPEAPPPTAAGLAAVTAALQARGASAVRATAPTTLAFGGGGRWNVSPLQPVSDGRVHWAADARSPLAAPAAVCLEFGAMLGLVTLYVVVGAVAVLVAAFTGVVSWVAGGWLVGAGAGLALGLGYGWAALAGRGAVSQALREAAAAHRAT